MITVIADDITGAAEIAGICLRYGLKVIFGINSVPDVEADVHVIATDSRSTTEIEAYNIHKKLAKAIFKGFDSFVFKKCDSVLRGFVLTELNAILEVTKLKRVLLQPANPATGRCIRNGIYYIGKEKIENTGFSIDPDFPAINSQVQKLLLQHSTYQENIPDIHTGIMTEIKGEGIFVPDCSSIEGLRKCCELLNNKTFLCGSAAFFEQVLLYKKIGKQVITNVPLNISTNFLMICGSTHPHSHQFVEQMHLSRYPVHFFPDAILQENITPGIIEHWTEELIAIWKKNKKLVLAISSVNIKFPNSSTILKSRMNEIVTGILRKCEVMEILIEGGATAYGILNLQNWKTLTPVQELLPGVLRLQVSDHPTTYLTVKPGSYRWPEYFRVEPN
jgi:uncharacterized protein YgbK (DUF1537 family)